MSYLFTAYLLEKYQSPRLTVKQLAEVLQVGERGLANRICRPDFPIRTYVESGQRWADIRDVIEYLDLKRQQASESTQA